MGRGVGHEEARMQEEQLRLPFREEHRALMRGLPGRRLFSTGAACRLNGGFDARRGENVPDTRTLSGESKRGEGTVAPCPLFDVQASIVETCSGIAKKWCAGYLALVARQFRGSLHVMNPRIAMLSKHRNPWPKKHHRGACDHAKSQERTEVHANGHKDDGPSGPLAEHE